MPLVACDCERRGRHRSRIRRRHTSSGCWLRRSRISVLVLVEVRQVLRTLVLQLRID
jgi:hypothetical protein